VEVNRYDLVVAGGGPAGTAAAIAAARDGASVLLLERGRFPRHKVCGEFVSAEALAVLRRLLGPDHQVLLDAATAITHARLFVDDSVILVPTGAAVSIARYELDQALWQAAQRAGVECRQQVAVTNVARGGDGFNITTTAGPCLARSVIDASGRWSNLRPHLPDARNGERNYLGLKAHFDSSNPDDSRQRTTDLYFFKGGYCGVQALADCELNVCAMVRAGAATQLDQVFALHPSLLARSRSWVPRTDVVATSPVIPLRGRTDCGGVLRAGDAAAFIDPFVGDGISIALRSGELASKVLQPFWRGAATLDQALRRYRREYETRFARAFLAASWLRTVMSAPRPIKQLALRTMRLPRVAEYVVRSTR
jgi:flavin-dependent dehydrogenase